MIIALQIPALRVAAMFATGEVDLLSEEREKGTIYRTGTYKYTSSLYKLRRSIDSGLKGLAV
jgi:hypothetical protein